MVRAGTEGWGIKKERGGNERDERKKRKQKGQSSLDTTHSTRIQSCRVMGDEMDRRVEKIEVRAFRTLWRQTCLS